VSSFASLVVPAREAVYAASKAAMNAFTEGLWHDLHGTGVHAALVLPGPIDTEIWAKTDEPHSYTGRRHPPERVASAIIEAAEGRHHEIVVPRRDPGLLAARWLRWLAPSLLRRGIQRMDPNPPEMAEAIRRRP
jgi:short-subunit dehydrogenase